MHCPEEMKSRYVALVKSRQKTVERGYKCLCCRDTGIIPGEVVRRYNLHEGMMGEYESVFMGESGLLCSNFGCEGNDTDVTIQSQDGGSYTKTVRKFAEFAVEPTITPDTCKWVHQQEWDRIRAFDAGMKSASPPNLNRAIAQIAKPMPKPQLQESPEKPVLEYRGFHVGDVVAITLERESEQDRRDILKSGLCPYDGKIGTIIRWESNQSLGQGLKIFEPVIDVEGQEWIGALSWLKPLEVAV
jgi:hypothetical protein